MSLLTPDFGLLFWMLLSFLTVFGLLAKFGFPVITGMVDKRRKYISESITNADEANSRLAGIKQESETIINEARTRQNELIKQATEEGNKLVQAAKDKASEEAQKTMADAQKQIETQRQKAISGIRIQIADLSVGIAEKILRKKLESPESQDELINRLLDEVERQT